jgi:CotH kinase protein
MEERKRSLLVFVIAILLCATLAVISCFFIDTKNKFQQDGIPSPLLSYGETGKILRELGAILPLEDKKALSGFMPNTVDFAGRAAREKKKWLLLEKYKRYVNEGIYGYIEMQSAEPDVPFTVDNQPGIDNKRIVNSKVRLKKVSYPFFIDQNNEKINIQLSFGNKISPVKITGMAFFQKGYHPLIYTEPIAFNNFLRKNSKKHVSITKYGVQIPASHETTHLHGKATFQKKTLAGISKFQKKQGNTHIKLVAKKDHPLLKNIKIPNHELADMSRKKISVLAIDVDEVDLRSKEYGILTNFDEHGRRWERLSYVRLFRDGQNIFSNFSGVRLQGGDPGRAKGLINFRLFFREEYGKSMIKADRLFGGAAGDIKRLAIKQSEWPKWPLNSPIAYDVSRQMGVLAPTTEMILLYLNGESLGLYYIVPHLGEKQIKSTLPDNDYKYYRIRGNQHDSDKHFLTNEFFKVLGSQETISEEFASQFFDLENLSRQIFSYMANATGDFCQGIVLKSENPGSKMFWYSWDMDHSYIDVPVEVKKTRPNLRERWEQPPGMDLALFKQKPGEKKYHCARVRLLKRLVNEDPVFRAKTKHLFASIMNHQLTDKFISQLLDEYQRKLEAISYPGGEEYITILRDFFSKREQFLLEEMQTQFPTEEPVVCRVNSENYPIEIDGFTKEEPYEGTYFPGATLSLAPAGDNTIKYWIINGEKVEQDTTSLLIKTGQQCEIKAVQ